MTAALYAVREKTSFLAGEPTSVSPLSRKAMSAGVERLPCSFSTTRASPASTTAAIAADHSL